MKKIKYLVTNLFSNISIGEIIDAYALFEDEDSGITLVYHPKESPSTCASIEFCQQNPDGTWQSVDKKGFINVGKQKDLDKLSDAFSKLVYKRKIQDLIITEQKSTWSVGRGLAHGLEYLADDAWLAITTSLYIMTNNVYVISDLHLGHKKLIDERGVDDDHIIDCWNSIVTKRDVVYVLGDIFTLDRVPELKGRKKLILGNHDKRPIRKYLEYFSKVSGYHVYDNCLLSHIPVHPSQKYRYRLNIHGHTHQRVIDDPWYVNVCVEQLDYTPILLREVCKEK